MAEDRLRLTLTHSAPEGDDTDLSATGGGRLERMGAVAWVH
jgi:hypothetical protein